MSFPPQRTEGLLAPTPIDIQCDFIDNGPTLDLGPGIDTRLATWFGRDDQGEHDQWVATIQISPTAEIGKRTLAIFNVDGTQGSLEVAFEVKERLPHLCPPIEFVVPAGAHDWIDEEYERTRDPKRPLAAKLMRNQLLDSLYDIADRKVEYVENRKEMETALRALYRAEKGDKEAFEKALEEWELLSRAVVQPTERGAMWGQNGLAEALDFGEEYQLASSLRRRLRCLANNTQSALDEVRKYNYTTSWGEYSRKKRIYDVHFKDLEHLGRLYSAFNQSRLLASQRRLTARRHQLAGAGQLSGSPMTKALRPIQRRMKNIYVDMGEVSIRLAQIAQERGLLEQDAYLAGIWAVGKEAAKIEEQEGWRAWSAQGVIFGMKYLLSAGGAAMGAGVDTLARVANTATNETVGVELVETVSAGVSKNLLKSRKRYDLVIRGQERLRSLDDKSTADLIARYYGDAALVELEKDRGYQEQTSGGVRRLAACYEDDPIGLMDRELTIALAHAELVHRDMDRAYNTRVFGNPQGKFEPIKRLLTDPLGTAAVLIQASSLGGDHFSAPSAYVANKKAQVQEMETVLEALRRARFDPLKLRRDQPKSYVAYVTLRKTDPDFLQWTLVRERLAGQARAERIATAMGRANSDREQQKLVRMLQLSRHWVTQQIGNGQARVYQLQGVERLMVWDYDGALACFYQAAELDPKGELIKLAGIEELRKAISWQKTVESGIALAAQIGNAGVHTALFEAAAAKIAARLPISKVAKTETALPEGFFYKSLPFPKFTRFLAEQVNPFSAVVKAATLEAEWSAVGKALLGMGQSMGVLTLQQKVIQKGILEGIMGVDAQWADFLANAIVSTLQAETDGQNKLIVELAKHLKGVSARVRLAVVNSELLGTRREARHSLSDFYRYFKWTQEFHEAQRAQRLRRARRTPTTCKKTPPTWPPHGKRWRRSWSRWTSPGCRSATTTFLRVRGCRRRVPKSAVSGLRSS